MARLRIRPSRQLGVDLAKSQLALVEQLILIRKARGLTQRQVAEKMGATDHTAVSKFESSLNSGKHPGLLTIKRYAEAVEAYVAHVVVDGKVDQSGERAYADLQKALFEHLKFLDDAAEQRESADATHIWQQSKITSVIRGHSSAVTSDSTNWRTVAEPSKHDIHDIEVGFQPAGPASGKHHHYASNAVQVYVSATKKSPADQAQADLLNAPGSITEESWNQ